MENINALLIEEGVAQSERLKPMLYVFRLKQEAASKVKQYN